MGKIKKNSVHKRPQVIVILVEKIKHNFGASYSPWKYTKRAVRLILTSLKKHPQEGKVLCPFCQSDFEYSRNPKRNWKITGGCIQCGLKVSFNL
jgi:hypothetical protein